MTDTRSYWMKTELMPTFSQLDGDLETDVAIVGGGITGVTAAVLLKRTGRRVALLEARSIGAGETGHTTAHLTEAIDTDYRTIRKKFGLSAARAVADGSRTAIDCIASFVRLHQVPGFRVVPAFQYAERKEDVRKLERQCAVAHKCGLRASMVTEVPLPFPVQAALRVEEQAEFNPMAYLGALVRSLPGDECDVFEGTRVVEVHDGHPVRVVTTSGTVRCKDVIVASNVPLNRVLLQTKIAHYRSYAIAIRLTSGIAPGLYWDMSDPYHYVRLASGDGMLLIVGGEDHRTGAESATIEHFEALEDWARARFPVGVVEHRWSGQIIEPMDGLPLIGKNSLSGHVYVASGFSGNGMTFGTVAAMLLSDQILGRDNSWAKVYDPTRIKPLASAKEFVAENVAFPVRFVADRVKRQAQSPDAVRPGEGKVVRMGGERYAVYREPRGALKVLSAVCTHLKCVVQFNDAERTWDCPCHGSRFDVDGNVLNGPAVRRLEKKQLPEPVVVGETAAARR